jgi:hypothetical protein
MWTQVKLGLDWFISIFKTPEFTTYIWHSDLMLKLYTASPHTLNYFMINNPSSLIISLKFALYNVVWQCRGHLLNRSVEPHHFLWPHKIKSRTNRPGIQSIHVRYTFALIQQLICFIYCSCIFGRKSPCIFFYFAPWYFFVHDQIRMVFFVCWHFKSMMKRILFFKSFFTRPITSVFEWSYSKANKNKAAYSVTRSCHSFLKPCIYIMHVKFVIEGPVWPPVGPHITYPPSRCDVLM